MGGGGVSLPQFSSVIVRFCEEVLQQRFSGEYFRGKRTKKAIRIYRTYRALPAAIVKRSLIEILEWMSKEDGKGKFQG